MDGYVLGLKSPSLSSFFWFPPPALSPFPMSSLPPEFWLGIDQFNQGEFYACHDTLEAVWLEAAEPEKRFYQGILQIAVALYHFENHNWRGTVTLLGEGLQRLQAYQPDYEGIAVESFAIATRALLVGLQAAGAERIQEIQLGPTDQQVAETAGQLWLPRPVIQKTVD
jgi:uncharacterized protein